MASVGTYRYVIRDTCRLFFRHWGLSLLTLCTAASIFFLLGGSLRLALYAHKVSQNVQGSLIMQAYTSSENAAGAVRDALAGNVDIEEIRLVSPQEALEVLRAKLGSQAQSMMPAGDVPLPWTVEIKLRDASLSAAVAKELSGMTAIDEIMYAGNLSTRLTKIAALITNIAMAILVIAVLVSGLVFYNMIRISIYSRRQEISVMLLVGSTRSYVASPFLMHGMILGLLGAIIAIVLLHYGQSYIAGTLDEVLPFLSSQLQWREQVLLDQVLLAIGFATGWIYSYIAVRRYIREAAKPL